MKLITVTIIGMLMLNGCGKSASQMDKEMDADKQRCRVLGGIPILGTRRMDNCVFPPEKCHAKE